MAIYSPPTENLPIFDNEVFITGDEPLTYNQAKKKFLRYPTAQGKETLQAVDVNGVATFKNNIVQSGQEINIIQTDQDTNTNPNQLRPTDIYGDLNLRRPTAGGGALRAWDVAGNSGYSLQLYQSGLTSNWIGLPSNNTMQIITYSAGGTQRQMIKANASTGTIIQTSTSDSGTNAQLRVAEINTSKCVSIYADAGAGNYNGLVSAGDAVVFATTLSGVPGTETLTLTTHSTNTAGVRIQPTGTMTLAGTANFSSTTPPTSAQVIPASNDNSNKIPTTAWVQSVISGNLNPTFNSVYLTPTPNPTGNSTSGLGNQCNMGGIYGQQLAGGYAWTSYFTPNRPIQISFRNNTGTNPITAFGSEDACHFKVSFYYWDFTTPNTYGQYDFDLLIFGRALNANWGADPNIIYSIDNKINGNNSFNYTDATWAPYGRQYWTYNQNFTTFNLATPQYAFLRGVNNLPGIYTVFIYFQMPNPNCKYTYTVHQISTNSAQNGPQPLGVITYS